MSYQAENEAAVEEKDNPEARKVLEKAFNLTWRWPAGFPGFSSKIRVLEGGGGSVGQLEVDSDGKVQLELNPSDHKDWLQSQIEMVVVHRRGRRFEESDGKHILGLAPDDQHPLGRTIRIHGDGMNSFYRVKNDRITQINRKNKRVQFTINVEESRETSDGRHLTTRHTVFYFNPATGALRTVECFADEHKEIDGVYLPSARTVNLVEGGQVATRRVLFTDHKLVKK